VTEAEGLLEINRGAYDSSWGDLDVDGDLDLVASTSSGTRERVYTSNASANGNNWVFVHLRQTSRNTRAVGAQVYATIHAGTPEEFTQRREANTNAGTFAQNDLPVHFGLGSATVIDELRIVWPDGTEDIHREVAVNRHMTLTPLPPAPGGSSWFIH
jgi:hypothetical protein